MDEDFSPISLMNETSASNFGQLIISAYNNDSTVHRAKHKELSKILGINEPKKPRNTEYTKDINEKSNYVPLSKRFNQ